MSENAPPSVVPTAGDVPGQPYYEKTRRHLQELLRKKNILTNNLANLEDQIYKKETEYLEETPSGNIITGFENYTKGTSGIGGGRKRGNVVDGNRVFSKSSISFNANAVSASFPYHSFGIGGDRSKELIWKTGFSNAFCNKHTRRCHGSDAALDEYFEGTGAGMKKKKRDVGEDSETDTREGKKVRTNFGAARK
ncbi:Chromatin modification-related [Hyphodiscus hymeniophilus]|uniref:Chromatin modification-related protein EAF6 n=1 Tax=Hyphodiscus hymeniophilus TaxID=353542 RepID=A0A9P6VMR9_9HELO|nr:Chromatin modification-related [Hyphodiscus hymeniophilus]